MKCYECGSEYFRFVGPYRVKDEFVGEFIVDGLEYFNCRECGATLLPPRSIEVIEERRRIQLEESVALRPLRDFVSASEAARLLGVTRQAFHKNKRIRAGFIYRTPFGEGFAYLAESVRRFGRTGDGRFPLRPSRSESIDTPKFSPPLGTEFEPGSTRSLSSVKGEREIHTDSSAVNRGVYHVG